jgi:hypothetical protein
MKLSRIRCLLFAGLALGVTACSNTETAPKADATPKKEAPSKTETTGRIGGRIEFPSDSVPAMTIVLLKSDDPTPIKVRTVAGQSRYSVTVPPGRYYVYAIPDDRPDPLLLGAHTEYSPCNARMRRGEPLAELCRTGPPREVTVAAGASVTDADIDDWYLTDEVAEALLALSGESGKQ